MNANAHFATYVEFMETNDDVPFADYCVAIDTLVSQGETLADYSNTSWYNDH